MAICPFAIWQEITGPSGQYTSGPFKIVHHTTEGATAAGAFDAFKKNRSDPHFTVDASAIYQHVDTGLFARSLRNKPAGVQTNKDSAVQIEVVGFAHLPKGEATLTNVAKLCRWIESTHEVPRTWPNGPPKPAVNGRDPGGHNRSVETWDQESGHYGHCHVPENTHWDPGYTEAEVQFLMSEGVTGGFASASPAAEAAARAKLPVLDQATLYEATSTMPDHADVGEM